jgi:pyruvate dehydrogenase E2 component (dihydrolipoamide acetyltransferase)
MNTSFDATAILELRKKIKALGKDMGLSNITLNDMSLYAVSRVLPDFRELNANFTEETLRVFKNVNLGVAVDTDRGLMVPTIFNANRKSLNEISAEARNLAEQCRNRTIKPDDLTGGTFTVTNLGALGIESFTPIINPPQTGILGVSGIVQRIKDTGEGIRSYPAMGLSLTIDHRVVDGAPAARFLNALARSLENFDLFLAL